jgi:hypothetical protein
MKIAPDLKTDIKAEWGLNLRDSAPLSGMVCRPQNAMPPYAARNCTTDESARNH